LFAVYKTKSFARFARKTRISDTELWKAANSLNSGLTDADLGGRVIKQRIARSGEGKSGGSRSIIIFRKRDRAVFVFGFEKKDVANIQSNDLVAFWELAVTILGYTATELTNLAQVGALIEVAPPQDDHHG
jgi:hypothetical protein